MRWVVLFLACLGIGFVFQGSASGQGVAPPVEPGATTTAEGGEDQVRGLVGEPLVKELVTGVHLPWEDLTQATQEDLDWANDVMEKPEAYRSLPPEIPEWVREKREGAKRRKDLYLLFLRLKEQSSVGEERP